MKRNTISRPDGKVFRPGRHLMWTVRLQALAAAVFALSSCDAVYDDLDPCPEGVSLRFVYDYNMEYANAFPKKVDCLTLYIYDAGGNYMGTRTETSQALSDESYRMDIDLAAGDYHFVAYGGMACDKASFATVTEPSAGASLSGLSTVLIHEDGVSDRELHDFYFGSLDVTVPENGTSYTEGTVEMMKNTNNIRIVLQQLSGEPVSDADFTFTVTDDNTRFGYDNGIISAGTISYLPWSTGQMSAGTRTDGDGEEVVTAYAELSCSRLVTSNSPRLVVCRASDGGTVIDIPLINYLLLVKSDHYGDMGSQEFLDRQSDWSLMFFLDEGQTWARTYIVINDWTVRINDASVQ